MVWIVGKISHNFGQADDIHLYIALAQSGRRLENNQVKAIAELLPVCKKTYAQLVQALSTCDMLLRTHEKSFYSKHPKLRQQCQKPHTVRRRNLQREFNILSKWADTVYMKLASVRTELCDRHTGPDVSSKDSALVERLVTARLDRANRFVDLALG